MTTLPNIPDAAVEAADCDYEDVDCCVPAPIAEHDEVLCPAGLAVCPECEAPK